MLGKRIKEKYGFYEEKFSFELISTQSKRTIETARNFMKGLLNKKCVRFNHEIIDSN